MDLLLLSLGLLLGSAVGALLLFRVERAACLLAALGGVAGCVMGLVPVRGVLAGAELPGTRVARDVPYGSFAIVLGLTRSALWGWSGR